MNLYAVVEAVRLSFVLAENPHCLSSSRLRTQLSKQTSTGVVHEDTQARYGYGDVDERLHDHAA